MLHVSLFQEFDIQVYDLAEWSFAPHKHTFFELIYVLEGAGIHRINTHSVEYTRGAIFLLTPADTHHFEIAERSRFCVMTFTEVYFSKSQANAAKHDAPKDIIDFSEMFTHLERIFYNLSTAQTAISLGEQEQEFCASVIKQIIQEAEARNLFYAHIVRHLMIVLLSMIGRALQEIYFFEHSDVAARSEILDVVNYIQQNITRKDALSLQALATTFHKSKDSLSEYFKAHTGRTVKEFITEYRLSLVKMRLLCTNMTISEIAFELGFTDESHLNKIFKTQHRQTAKEYRQSRRLHVQEN